MSWLKNKVKDLIVESIKEANGIDVNRSSASMVREHLGGFDIAAVDIGESITENMSAEEARELIFSAHRVFNESAFRKVLQFLIGKQIDVSVTKAETMEQVLMGRFTINGLHLVLEEFEQLASDYDQMKLDDQETHIK